jgi:cell division transport system permease protein
LSAWLRQHRQALRAALKRLGVLNALVIGVALSLPAGGYALLESLRDVVGRFALDAQVSVFLRPDAKRADAETLSRALRADRRIGKLRYVPRDEALKQLAAVQGMPEVIAALGSNPLPDAFVVTATEGSLEALAADLGKLPGVAYVQADAAWARRLAALAGIGRLAVWLLAALLGIGLVAVTFNTIRLQILTQREEIEVSKLIGATDAFIRRPFLYYGLLLGLAGGLAGWGLVTTGTVVFENAVADLARAYGTQWKLRNLPLRDSVSLVSFAAVLGWLGAWLCVARHLAHSRPH